MRRLRSAPLPVLLLPVLSLCLLTQASCGDDGLDPLAPLLQVQDAAPDPSLEAQWLVDFGDVPAGGVAIRSLVVRNAGRSPLSLDAPQVAVPFVSRTTTSTRLQPKDTWELVFEFHPAAPGPAGADVTLTSDGGNATVRFTGSGAAAGDCVLQATPAALDFGSVARTASADQGTTFANTGSAPCRLAGVALAADTDTSFSLRGTYGAATLEAGDTLQVTVHFAPAAWGSHAGRLQVQASPPDRTLTVALTGASPEPCPGALPDGTCPRATESAYINSTTDLYSHDPVANTTRHIGQFKVDGVATGGFTDIAIDSQGLLFGYSNGGFYSINPNTAEAQKVAVTAATEGTGLTFLSDGHLVVAGPRVDIVDRGTGQVVRTLVPAGRFTTSGDIVALPDGLLYWAVRGSNGDQLVRIDPRSGETTVIGSVGVSGVYGLGYANGVLLGYTSNGRALEIDPQTAKVLSNKALAGAWWGAATNPVRW
jgi:hypothetical protein